MPPRGHREGSVRKVAEVSPERASAARKVAEVSPERASPARKVAEVSPERASPARKGDNLLFGLPISILFARFKFFYYFSFFCDTP